MSFAHYMRSLLPDFALCALMALGLGLNVVQGFHIPDDVAENVPLVLAATALPLAALLPVGYSKRTLAAGVPALLVALVAYGIVLAQLTPTPLFAENYENTSLVFVVLLPVAIAVFLLSRTRSGLVIAFAAGSITCAAIQFLYGKDLVVATALFVVACAALYLVKSSLMPSGASSGTALAAALQGKLGPHATEGAGSPAPEPPEASSLAARLPQIGMAIALALLAALLAAGTFLAIIAPLNPPARELKLITEYYSLEEVHVSGVLAFLHQRNDSLTSRNQNDETDYSSTLGDETQDAEGESDMQRDDSEEQLGEGSFDTSPFGAALSIIRYLQEHWWIGIIALIALAALWVFVVATRRFLRKRRLSRWQSLGPQGEYLQSFDHICAVLEKARLIERGSKTPHELALAASEQTRNLERYVGKKSRNNGNGAMAGQIAHPDAADRIGQEALSGDALTANIQSDQTGGIVGEAPEFPSLARSYARISYGADDPSKQELDALESYVQLLPKRLCRTIGHIKYLRHFFTV